MKLPIHRLDATAIWPRYSTDGAAGLDLAACLPEGVVVMIKPGGRMVIPTGLAMAIPSGYEGQVRPRSGLTSKKGVPAALGTIDSDYRGEVAVTLFNFGEEEFPVRHGDRIGQMVITKCERIKLHQVSMAELGSTARGKNGFGSTGVASEPVMEPAKPAASTTWNSNRFDLIDYEEKYVGTVTFADADSVAAFKKWWQIGRDKRLTYEAATTQLVKERDELRERLASTEERARKLDVDLNTLGNDVVCERGRVRKLCEVIDAVSPDHDHGMLQIDWDAWWAIKAARNNLQHTSCQLPPGWRQHINYPDSPEYEAYQFGDNAEIGVYYTKRSDMWSWSSARGIGGPSVNSMHEAMRLARKLTTVDELWGVSDGTRRCKWCHRPKNEHALHLPAGGPYCLPIVGKSAVVYEPEKA